MLTPEIIRQYVDHRNGEDYSDTILGEWTETDESFLTFDVFAEEED